MTNQPTTTDLPADIATRLAGNHLPSADLAAIWQLARLTELLADLAADLLPDQAAAACRLATDLAASHDCLHRLAAEHDLPADLLPADLTDWLPDVADHLPTDLAADWLPELATDQMPDDLLAASDLLADLTTRLTELTELPAGWSAADLTDWLTDIAGWLPAADRLLDCLPELQHYASLPDRTADLIG